MTTRDLEAYQVGVALARQSRGLGVNERAQYVARALFDALDERGILAGDERSRWRAAAVRGYLETIKKEG